MSTNNIGMQELTPLSLFLESLKSKHTKRTYTYHLQKFLKATSLDMGKLLAMDTKSIETVLIQYIVSMKERDTSYLTRQLSLAAITSFLSANEVEINKKRVTKFLGEHKKTVDDRPYTREEIAKILTKCDERKRVIILVLSSTGMRVGALAEVRIKNMKRIDNLYQFTLYPGSKKDQHITFCTPECAAAIDSYLEYRRQYGEKITENSPLIRDQFDKADPFHAAKGTPLLAQGLGVITHGLLVDAGLRTRSTEGQKYKRQEVMANHGFRKYFATTLTKATKNAFMVETLLGHDTGLVGTYNKPTDEDKLAFYLTGVNDLTINEENRLKHQNVILKGQVDDISALKERVVRQEKKYTQNHTRVGRPSGKDDIEKRK